MLENGLRVASQAKFGQFCTVGVCIDSGARFVTFELQIGVNSLCPNWNFDELHVRNPLPNVPYGYL